MWIHCGVVYCTVVFVMSPCTQISVIHFVNEMLFYKIMHGKRQVIMKWNSLLIHQGAQCWTSFILPWSLHSCISVYCLLNISISNVMLGTAEEDVPRTSAAASHQPLYTAAALRIIIPVCRRS